MRAPWNKDRGEGDPPSDPLETPVEGTAPEPEPEPEPTLPANANLDELYSADGQSLYEDADGNAVDAEGNRIPSMRPEPPLVEAKVEEPKVEPRQFVSPNAADLLAADEKEVAEQEFTPGQLALLQKITERAIARDRAATAQHRVAMQQWNLPSESYDEFAEEMAAADAMVPQHLRGTPTGALSQVLMAAGARADKTGDLRGTLLKLLGTTSPAAPVKEPEVPLPPSARTTQPRANPEAFRRVQRSGGAADITNDVFKGLGYEGDAASVLDKEYRRANHA